jgi:hypothetical protein
VDELGIRLFRPTLRRLKDLVGKRAYGNGDGDAHRDEEGKLVLPIETSRGNRRVGQRGEREVVENVVAREAFVLPVEALCDQLVTSQVVVEEPGSEPDRGIRNSVQRLRVVRHLLGLRQAVSKEEGEPFERIAFVGREVGRDAVPGLERLENFDRDGGRYVDVDAEQSRRRLRAHLLRDEGTPIAALRHISRVAKAVHQRGPGAMRGGSHPVLVGLPENP